MTCVSMVASGGSPLLPCMQLLRGAAAAQSTVWHPLQANGISVASGGGGGLLKGVGRWLDRGINRLIGGDTPASGATNQLVEANVG